MRIGSALLVGLVLSGCANISPQKGVTETWVSVSGR